MAILHSEGEELVLAGLTSARLVSDDVAAFGKLQVDEVKAEVTVGGKEVLAGNQSFSFSNCTPAKVANILEKTCQGSGTIQASGSASFDGGIPLLLVGDKGQCSGTCTLKTSPPSTTKVTCSLRVRKSGQQAEQAKKVAKSPKAAAKQTTKPEQQFALCYRTGTNEVLLLTEKEYLQLHSDSSAVEAAVTKLAEAKRSGDEVAIRSAKSECEKHLPSADADSGPRMSKTHIAEVIDFRGRKATYVRSDKIRNHWRHYPIDVDVRDQSKLRDKEGRFDPKKVKTALAQVKGKAKIIETQPWETDFVDWAEQFNKAHHIESSTDPAKDENTRLDYSLHAQLLRCYGRWFALGFEFTKLTEWEFSAESFMTVSLLDAKAALTLWPFTRAGFRLNPHPPGFRHSINIGSFRIRLDGRASAFAGITVAISAKIGLSSKEKHAGLSFSGDAFAGAQAEVNVAGGLGWKSPTAVDWNEIGKVSYGLTGGAGIGAGFSVRLGYDTKLKKVMLRVKGQLVVGFGGGGEFNAEVDPKHIVAVTKLVVHAVVEADFAPIPELIDATTGYVIAIEEEVRQLLAELVVWSTAFGMLLEDAYRLIDLVKSWWQQPWTTLDPSAFAGRLAAGHVDLNVALPEAKAKLLALLCDERRYVDQAQRENAVAIVMATIRTDNEMAYVLESIKPADHPGGGLEEGRRYLVAHGGPAAAQLAT